MASVPSPPPQTALDPTLTAMTIPVELPPSTHEGRDPVPPPARSENARRFRWQQAASGVPLPTTAWERENAARLRWLALALVAVGLAWRCTRYLLRFPIWGDEAMLLVNYFTRGYLDIFGPIEHVQIAPLLFHFAEIFAFRWLGPSELSLRLVPFLACLGSMALFWRLAGLTLPPLARAFAVAVFSVSIWPATMGSLVKPYTLDLFFSLALLVLALTWLARPERLAPLVWLALVAPVAVASSYPSVFIGGAVGLVLLPTVWRTRRPHALAVFGLYGVLLCGTFLAHYLFVSRPHMATSCVACDTMTAMQRYWNEGFPPPPSQPLHFLQWLVLAHLGQVAAYPLGASNGGSIGTVALSLVGAVWLWRRGQRRLLALMAASFGLWFVAGALQRYPYAASCRLSQHVAPFYCLLAGLGGAVLVLRLAADRSRWRAALWTLGLLAAVGVGGTVRDVLKPYRDDDARWARMVANDLLECAGDDPVVLVQDPEHMNPLLTWHLGSRGVRAAPAGEVGWARLGRQARSVWVFYDGPQSPQRQEHLRGLLEQGGAGWSCAERQPRLLAQSLKQPCLHCQAYHWVRSGPRPVKEDGAR
jgi:hypothetical protein